MLARCFRGLGLFSLPLASSGNRLPILAYHRLLDDDTPLASVADTGLFSATAAAFQRQMRFVARHFNTVTFQDLASGCPLPPRPLLISFDDGFEDNFRLAFPVLQSLNLKAAFFVTTDFIDARAPLWFDVVSRLLTRAHQLEDIRVGGSHFPTGRQPPERLVAAVLAHLKTLPGEQRREAIDALQSQLDLSSGLEGGSPMSWSQLRAMADAGMEIGSHSCSHTLLAGESPGTIRDELVHSRQRIETMLQRPCLSLAYPVGGYSAVNGQVVELAGKAGYRFACTYISGVNPLPLENPLALRRLHVEQDMDFALFQAQIACPRLFGYGRS